jgi:type II secretion system protein I
VDAFARHGFSLLEVIIATAILSSSALLLLSLLATGERHSRRAEERVRAQLLCQAKLDELLADPSQIRKVEAEVMLEAPGWAWSADWQPTQITGLAELRVSVTRIPGFVAADAASPAPSPTEPAEINLDGIPDRPTFELCRRLKFAGTPELPGETLP